MKKPLHVTIDADLRIWIELYADAHRLSLSTAVNGILAAEMVRDHQTQEDTPTRPTKLRRAAIKCKN